MLHSVQFAPMINSQVFEQYFGFKHTDQSIAREQEDSAGSIVVRKRRKFNQHSRAIHKKVRPAIIGKNMVFQLFVYLHSLKIIPLTSNN